MKFSLKTHFWYWVYRWSHRLFDYAEKTADASCYKDCHKGTEIQ